MGMGEVASRWEIFGASSQLKGLNRVWRVGEKGGADGAKGMFVPRWHNPVGRGGLSLGDIRCDTLVERAQPAAPGWRVGEKGGGDGAARAWSGHGGLCQLGGGN
jgi:hypothetical protein